MGVSARNVIFYYLWIVPVVEKVMSRCNVISILKILSMQNVTDLARKKCHVEGIPARLFVVLIENYQETAKYKFLLE